MAIDRPDCDAEGAGRYPRGGRPGGRAGAGRAEPAEPRSISEYYEALRAADGQAGPGRSGWDSIDEAERPDGFRVSPERRAHILDGDANGGGGHRHGTGNPGKTEFPASWDDEKVMGNVLDVARRPDSPPVLQDRNNRWVCIGTRDSVEVSVIVLRSGEVWTAWPEEGSPGVVRNPRKGQS